MKVDLKSLIKKYSVNIPRYTSYPTAVEFTDKVTNDDLYLVLDNEVSSSTKPISIYTHLPFCHSLCYFCACNKIIPKSREGLSDYLAALFAEIKLYSDRINDLEVDQFHWGGGTPNFLNTEETTNLFFEFKKYFPNFTKDADISVEIDPRTCSFDHLRTYRDLGFNRVSMGVQDFDLNVQEAINRVQPFELTSSIFQEIRRLKFNGINLDLLYGLPLQNETSFKDTIEKVISLMPDRIALYGYAHVTWKQKVQKSLQRHDLPSPEVRINLFLLALEMLTNAGYEYIGMDHFALPSDDLCVAKHKGSLNRNFMGYTTHKDTYVAGFGVSSVSTYDSIISMNESKIDNYIDRIGKGELPVAKGVLRSRDDLIEADIIERLLCHGFLKVSELQNKWDFEFKQRFAGAINELRLMQEDGLVNIDSDCNIEVTDFGRLFLRNIASKFDSYLAKHVVGNKHVFSQSV